MSKLTKFTKRVLGISLSVVMAFSGIHGTAIFHFDTKPVVKAADSTVPIDSSAVVQLIDSKVDNRPGIPDGTLLNELKRVVNTSLGRDVYQNITFGELMEYGGEIDLTPIASQITSIKGLGYARSATRINISSVSLLAIDDYEFDGCKALKQIDLPPTLVGIGKFAFRNCKELETITLPDSVQIIGESAFDACMKIKRMDIPAGVTSIGKGAFGGCTSLQTMTIINPNIQLGASVFEGCTELATCSLPEGIKEIPASFFASSGLNEFNVPTTVEKIEKSAFNHTQLKNVDLTACTRLTVIGNGAYAVCKSLESIKLPNSVTSIRSSAFDSSGLKSITIPDSVVGSGENDDATGIGRAAFWNCFRLESVSIPQGVTQLNEMVFSDCISLTSVEIRNVSASQLKVIGEKAFENCISLTNTEFIAGLPGLETIEKDAFKYDAKAIDNFYVNLSLSFLHLGRNSTTENKDEFGNTLYLWGLKSIHLPNSLQKLGIDAFSGQYNVEKIDMGNGLTEIPANSFKGFGYLKTVTFSNKLLTIGDSAFENCIRMQELNLPNTLIEIGKSAFSCTSPLSKGKGMNYALYYISTSGDNATTTRTPGDTTSLESIIVTGEKPNQKFEIRYIDMSKDKIKTESDYKKMDAGEQSTYSPIYIVAQKKYVKQEDVYAGKECCPGDVKTTKKTAFGYNEQTNHIVSVDSWYIATESAKDANMMTVPTAGYLGFYFQMSGKSLNYLEHTGYSTMNMPDSVKKIGEKCFYDCYGLQNIVLSKQLDQIEKSSFAYSKRLDTYQYDWTDTDKSFYAGDYWGIRSVTFQDDNKKIMESAFMNNANMVITGDKLPANLEIISKSAFEECASLTTIAIPSKVASIGERAFFGCSEYGDTKSKVDSYKIYVMEKDYGLKEVDMTQAASLTTIGKYAFSLTPLLSLSIPSGVKVLDEGTFQNCFYLTKVSCSDNLENVNKLAFSNCVSLVSITIPAHAYVDYQSFAGYDIGEFSFAITNPDSVSVSLGEKMALSINTFPTEHLRDELKVSEKDGTTGCVSIEESATTTINKKTLRVPTVKGMAEGSTRISVLGTINYELYGGTVITKAPEVIINVNVTKYKCTGIEDDIDKVILSIADTDGVKISPKILPANCTEQCVWYMDNQGIVDGIMITPDKGLTDSAIGLFPVGLGTSKVTLRCGSVKKTYQVNVVVPASQINVPDSITLQKNENGKNIGATMSYDTGKYSQNQWENYGDILSYTSSNEKVVKVSPVGELTPMSIGKADITVEAIGSGMKKKVSVTVDKTTVATPNPATTLNVNGTPDPNATPQPFSTPVPGATFAPEQTAEPTVTAKPVKVAKVSLTSVKNLKGKKLQVKWKKASGASGYCVTIATNKKFTMNSCLFNVSKKTTTKKISGLLKGKIYYVKVQAYKKVNGKKIYGKPSKIKKIKIKK